MTAVHHYCLHSLHHCLHSLHHCLHSLHRCLHDHHCLHNLQHCPCYPLDNAQNHRRRPVCRQVRKTLRVLTQAAVRTQVALTKPQHVQHTVTGERDGGPRQSFEGYWLPRPRQQQRLRRSGSVGSGGGSSSSLASLAVTAGPSGPPPTTGPTSNPVVGGSRGSSSSFAAAAAPPVDGSGLPVESSTAGSGEVGNHDATATSTPCGASGDLAARTAGSCDSAPQEGDRTAASPHSAPAGAAASWGAGGAAGAPLESARPPPESTNPSRLPNSSGADASPPPAARTRGGGSRSPDQQRQQELVVLYIHGGAFALGSALAYRPFFDGLMRAAGAASGGGLKVGANLWGHLFWKGGMAAIRRGPHICLLPCVSLP